LRLPCVLGFGPGACGPVEGRPLAHHTKHPRVVRTHLARTSALFLTHGAFLERMRRFIKSRSPQLQTAGIPHQPRTTNPSAPTSAAKSLDPGSPSLPRPASLSFPDGAFCGPPTAQYLAPPLFLGLALKFALVQIQTSSAAAPNWATVATAPPAPTAVGGVFTAAAVAAALRFRFFPGVRSAPL
jgi:hypothetical protein